MKERRRKRKVEKAKAILPEGYVPSSELDAKSHNSEGDEDDDVEDGGEEEEDTAALEEVCTRCRAVCGCHMYSTHANIVCRSVNSDDERPLRTRFYFPMKWTHPWMCRQWIGLGGASITLHWHHAEYACIMLQCSCRYRGLKSFRTSPWDPRESLPPSYAHIFEIPHYTRWQRQVLHEAALAEKALDGVVSRRVELQKANIKQKRHASQLKQLLARKAASASSAALAESAAAATTLDDTDMAGSTAEEAVDLAGLLGPGWIEPSKYVCLHLRNVPRAALFDVSVPGVPVTVFSLLRFENRASVMHFNIQRTAEFTEPIQAKVC
jgi:hypothetical protein